MGTCRVVYGTDVDSYIIASHSLTAFENRVQNDKLDLKEEGASGFLKTTKRRQLCIDKQAIDSYDYKGFNE